jgi:hypothetical protein
MMGARYGFCDLFKRALPVYQFASQEEGDSMVGEFLVITVGASAAFALLMVLF